MPEFNKISPEMIGYISEMQAQVSFLSDRAAGLASQLALANETIELQKGRIDALEKQTKKSEVNSDQESA